METLSSTTIAPHVSITIARTDEGEILVLREDSREEEAECVYSELAS